MTGRFSRGFRLVVGGVKWSTESECNFGVCFGAVCVLNYGLGRLGGLIPLEGRLVCVVEKSDRLQSWLLRLPMWEVVRSGRLS